MIITGPKDIDKVTGMLAGHTGIAIIGCGLCATVCGTGGKKEVSAMASTLARLGKKIIWEEIIDGVCQKQLTRKSISRLPAPEAILVMACGSGVQTVSGLVGADVYPALDSLFLGSVTRVGQFEEKCSLCGSCQLDEFGGFCPVTLCPKKIQNGPCGGMEEGKCEVNTDRDCVWHNIFLMKKESGRLADLEKSIPARSHRRPVKS